jgi:hypothetical protein
VKSPTVEGIVVLLNSFSVSDSGNTSLVVNSSNPLDKGGRIGSMEGGGGRIGSTEGGGGRIGSTEGGGGRIGSMEGGGGRIGSMEEGIEGGSGSNSNGIMFPLVGRGDN